MSVRILPILLVLIACNEGLIDSGGPCQGAACGRSCATDTDCDSRSYCGAEGTCRADCSPGGGQCALGTTCGFRGRCVAEPPQDGGHCPSVVVEAKPVVPMVQILIDQSGSMNDPFGSIAGMGVNRWQAVRYALTDGTNGAVTRLQDRVRFGATLYHSVGGSRNGATCPILTRSAGQPAGQPVLNNRAAIDSLLANNNPTRDTPTAESVAATTKDLQEYAKADPMAPRVLILATDGNPDSCADPDAHDEASRAASEKAVQSAFAAGIRTYVLSVGSDTSKTHLERLANAGVGKPLSPASEKFYIGNNPAELVSAFNEITRGVRSCSFTLNGDVQSDGPARATVTLNGKAIAYRTDWDLMGTRTLVLKGAACETFKNSDRATLSAEFPCGTVLF